MSDSQKKIIIGKSFLFPGDAIVEVSVSTFSPYHEETKAPCWHFGAACSLSISHANFPRKSREFVLFRTDMETAEKVVPGDRMERMMRHSSDEFRVMRLPGIAKSMDAVFFTRSILSDFVINEYIQGEVSSVKTLEFFRASYDEKLATK